MQDNITSDLQALVDQNFAFSGIEGLWLKIVILSVIGLLSKFPGEQRRARDFLFDTDNQFFDYVCQNLEYEPEALRAGIRKRMSLSPQAGENVDCGASS